MIKKKVLENSTGQNKKDYIKEIGKMENKKEKVIFKKFSIFFCFL